MNEKMNENGFEKTKQKKRCEQKQNKTWKIIFTVCLRLEAPPIGCSPVGVTAEANLLFLTSGGAVNGLGNTGGGATIQKEEKEKTVN